MSEEKSVDKMAYVRVSHRNIERIKAVGKKGETFDDVITKILDYYEDLRRQDVGQCAEQRESQYKKQIKDKRWFYTRFGSF